VFVVCVLAQAASLYNQESKRDKEQVKGLCV
jgi:hypothetical protein